MTVKKSGISDSHGRQSVATTMKINEGFIPVK